MDFYFLFLLFEVSFFEVVVIHFHDREIGESCLRSFSGSNGLKMLNWFIISGNHSTTKYPNVNHATELSLGRRNLSMSLFLMING